MEHCSQHDTGPSREVDFLIKKHLESVLRDIEPLISKVAARHIYHLAAIGVRQILQHGEYRKGYTHRDFVHMVAPTPWSYPPSRVHLTAKIEQGNVVEVGLDFFRNPETLSVRDDCCLFRCYIKEGIDETLAYFDTIRTIQLSRFDISPEERQKWDQYQPPQVVTGEYSESPISVTAMSFENYQRLEHINLPPQPELLAQHLLTEAKPH